MVTVKGKVIGGGKPCVCVPVMGREKKEIIEEIIALTKSPADIIEWRVDAFPEYLNFNEVRPNRSLINSTIFLYSGESVVAYLSRFLFSSPSNSLMMRRESSSKSPFEALNPKNGQL